MYVCTYVRTYYVANKNNNIETGHFVFVVPCKEVVERLVKRLGRLDICSVLYREVGLFWRLGRLVLWREVGLIWSLVKAGHWIRDFSVYANQYTCSRTTSVHFLYPLLLLRSSSPQPLLPLLPLSPVNMINLSPFFLQSVQENSMSITVHSFTLEPGSSLARNAAVGNIFIEYQFLNYDSSELETPSSLPKPQEGKEVYYNFRKGTYGMYHSSKTSTSA